MNYLMTALVSAAIGTVFLGCGDNSGGDLVDTSDTGRDTADGGADSDAERFDVAVHLASEEDPAAPGTVGIVTWSIEGAGALRDARIEFGLDTTYGMTAPVDLSAPSYRTLLLGMKPAHTYHFRIVADDETATYTSGDYAVDTGPPTDLVTLRGFNVLNDAEREPGFIIMSWWRGDEMAVPFILDADGDVVWWYETDLALQELGRRFPEFDTSATLLKVTAVQRIAELRRGWPRRRKLSCGQEKRPADNCGQRVLRVGGTGLEPATSTV